jgi:hypothetical protein
LETLVENTIAAFNRQDQEYSNNLFQARHFLGQDANWVLPEYKSHFIAE